MLRSIESVTFLALFMVGCGGGGSTDGSPPAPYTVGGIVTGLSGSGLVLHLAGGADLPISASGAFTFPTHLPSGASYAVTVKSSPTSPLQVCTVAGGVGTIAATNVTNVDVTCTSTSAYTIHGTVSGLVGSGLSLENCTPPSPPYHRGSHPTCHSNLQVSANGAFTLGSAYPAGYSGADYVDILQQPTSPAQHCVITNTTVSINALNDTGVTVSCLGEFVYVTNAADNTLSSYSVDGTTGALAAIGVPIAMGASPNAIVGGGCGYSLVFVANQGSNDISVFAADTTTGALTAVPGSPFAAGTDPEAMTCLFGGLLVANAGSDNVSAYGIDQSTRALIAQPGFPVAVGKSPTSIVVDPFTGFAYVANHEGSNDISAFSTLDLTPLPGSPFPVGGNPLSLALAPSAGGHFLYSANPDATNPSISGFSIDLPSGALSPLSGSPFPIPVSHYIATWDTGAPPFFLYVTSGASVVGYAIDATTGALTALPGFPVAVGANAYSISFDQLNPFLYVASEGAASISGFRVDASTGALTPIPGSPFPAGNQPKFMATF